MSGDLWGSATTRTPLALIQALLSRLSQNEAKDKDLQRVAQAYISDSVRGSTTDDAKNDLRELLLTRRETLESFPGEYSSTELFVEMLDDAFRYATAQGLGQHDVIALVRVLLEVLLVIRTEGKKRLPLHITH